MTGEWKQSRTRLQLLTGPTLSVLLFLFVFFSTSAAFAYYSSQSLTFSKRGETLTANFTNLPRAAGDVTVTIMVYGDYDSTLEYASIYLDGSYKGRLIGGDKTCNTSVLKNKGTYKTTAASTYDGKLTVMVRNSSSVDGAACSTSRVMIFVSYTANAPDFSIYSFSVSPTSTTRGGRVTVSYRIRNQGKRTGTAYLRLYLSPDFAITNKDIYLGHQRVLILAAGKLSSTYKVTVSIPSTAPGGTNYLGIFVDYDNRVAEDNENNNTRVAAIKIQVPGPDLRVTALTLTPTSLSTGSTFTAKITLKNEGDRTILTNFTVSYYYCSAFDLTTCTAAMGSQTITNNFLKGASYTYTTASLKLPSSAQAGFRALMIRVDSSNQVKESNELNNEYMRYVSVADTRPDLVVDGFSINPKRSSAGGTVAVQYRVKNKGLGNAGTFTLRLYFSTGGVITTNDTYLGHSRTLSLAKGAISSRYTVNITLPSNASSGNRYIGIIVDYDNKVAELNEGNNTDRERITIEETPDVVTESLSISPSPLQTGQSFRVTGVVRNPTRVSIRNLTVSLYVSTTSSVSTSSTLLKTWTFNELERGQSKTIAESLRLPSSLSGDKLTFGLIADPQNAIKESSETNNTKTTSVLYLRDVDKDGYWYTAGCPSSVPKCDCNDSDSSVNPGKKEICDGKDNNCDGSVDEGCACRNGQTRTCGSDVGECKKGKQTCSSGKWGDCLQAVTPKTEVCDKKDNDCDGKVDEDEVCKEPVKEPSPEPQQEPTQEVSPEPSPEPVVDAGKEPVPEKAPDGQKCQTQTCEVGHYCRNGQCVKACGCLHCPPGEKCVDGQCKQDLCDIVKCLDGEVCTDDGKCIGDPCSGVQCSQDKICEKGLCVLPPCEVLQCPRGMRCWKGQCLGKVCRNGELIIEPIPHEPTTPVTDAGVNQDSTGSTRDDSTPGQGGCLCETSSPSFPTSTMLWLFLLLLFRYRRTNRSKKENSHP